MGIKETLRLAEAYRQPGIQTGLEVGEYLRELAVRHGNVSVLVYTTMSGHDGLIGVGNFNPIELVTDGSEIASYLHLPVLPHRVPVNFDLMNATYVGWSGYPKQGLVDLLFKPKPQEYFIQTTFSAKDFRKKLSPYHLPSSITLSYDSHWGRGPSRVVPRQKRVSLGQQLGL